MRNAKDYIKNTFAQLYTDKSQKQILHQNKYIFYLDKNHCFQLLSIVYLGMLN